MAATRPRRGSPVSPRRVEAGPRAAACAKLQESKLIVVLRQADRDICQKDACHTLRQSVKIAAKCLLLECWQERAFDRKPKFFLKKTKPTLLFLFWLVYVFIILLIFTPSLFCCGENLSQMQSGLIRSPGQTKATK